MDPYATQKIMGIDYRFWNVFHSDFYGTSILTSKKGKICKMQHIDFNELQDKEEPEFNTAIRISDRFELSDLMSFMYDWNEEILAQFHATYYWNKITNELHWMMDGCHYRIDFVTFIHDENYAKISDISYMWRDPRIADGRRSGH
jgi:hypothetical protein